MLTPASFKVPAPFLMIPPLVTIPFKVVVTPVAVVNVRLPPLRLTSALKVIWLVLFASPKVTSPPMVSAFRIARLALAEIVPPLRVRVPLPTEPLVTAPTAPKVSRPRTKVPALRVVPPL